MSFKLSILLLLATLLFPAVLHAESSIADYKAASDHVGLALQAAENNDLAATKKQYEQFNTAWFQVEDGVKEKSKGAYRAIEETMGEVAFAFAQKPIKIDNIVASLRKLDAFNQKVIAGDYSSFADPTSKEDDSKSVEDLVQLLNQAESAIDSNDIGAAKDAIQQFRNYWLDIEGLVLTQSSKVYADAERDMVSSYALLTSSPPDVSAAKATIKQMRDYLAPLASKTSYTMVDVITILLREGMEALLVIVALLGFLNKSGNGEKKHWLWYGIGAGIAVSVAIGVCVKLLFSSGTFGNNNFLIAGCTGLFAAVMLLYMSYWLHSKSSIASWNRYIAAKSTKALASGSLWSISILAFLAVFREGTETVLFFIGMASSISISSLMSGIAVGMLLLAGLAFLIVKVGLRIPIRPFFLVSSVLVFYLCFKFLGMGIHGLQLSGVLQASHATSVPTIDALGFYSTWENIIPQILLLLAAVFIVIRNRIVGSKQANGQQAA